MFRPIIDGHFPYILVEKSICWLKIEVFCFLWLLLSFCHESFSIFNMPAIAVQQLYWMNIYRKIESINTIVCILQKKKIHKMVSFLGLKYCHIMDEFLFLLFFIYKKKTFGFIFNNAIGMSADCHCLFYSCFLHSVKSISSILAIAKFVVG